MKWFQQVIAYLTFALAIGSSAGAPAGRLAFINDASASRDADDVCSIPFQVALVSAFDTTSKLVHWSYACDYEGDVIREDRMEALELSLFGAIKIWHHPKNSAFKSDIYFNCRDSSQRTAGINHLRDRINESTAGDLLWIIEAGEPDVIGYALQASSIEKRQFVRVVTHHSHNDVGTHWKLSGNISDLPGMAKDFIIRIPDQNAALKKREKDYLWLKESNDPRLKFLWSRAIESTKLGWAPAPGTIDPSDVGMVWYVLDGGGDETPSPEKIGTKLSVWCDSHPLEASTTR